MDKNVTCEHLNQVVDSLGKELWHSKEDLVCTDCGCSGPNLWVCLQPDCHHVGCSEVKNDHSTIHHKNRPTHCVHCNVSTERIWCYGCEKEVYIKAALAHVAAQSPDSVSLAGSISSRIGAALSLSLDDDDDSVDFDDDGTRGLVGLQNMGNTCYMNAALQALSNTQPLTSYFLECSAAINVLMADKKPGLTRAYQKLIRDMWSRKTRGYVQPSGILYGIRNVHPQFRGYQQHDAQEFLRCFMDQLHEELKEPVWDNSIEDKQYSDAEGDHLETRILTRRRAASSGASDAPFFARMRRKSPAASYSESRAEGYLRVNENNVNTRHRRSASYGGTNFTYNLVSSHNQVNGPADSTQRSASSESELSSEADERYETCSSGASDADPAPKQAPSSISGGGDGGGTRYRSVISDVFDGKLLSSVQCLICARVSTRVETFQDLSLPIPSREQLSALRCQQAARAHTHDSWVWWLLSWLRSWLYGPVVTLQDCLAAFFSADELKGDNMYSCSRCKKLRNGVKMSRVVRLPEVLCIHLKRFRHELMFSAKVASAVAFPHNTYLNMQPYMHKDCTSSITQYELCSVISHSGTAGGGHYTCSARSSGGVGSLAGLGGPGGVWHTFDDARVSRLPAHAVPQLEAYVLFYRKVNPQMAVLRQKAAEIAESSNSEPNDIKFYISKQWINKFNTWAEPGAIDNSDFVCAHGGIRPARARHLPALAARLPQPLWQFLHDHFGGGPACSHAHACSSCARAAQRMRARRARELAAFADLHAIFQDQDRPTAIYAISMHWFRQWQAFVRNKAEQPPPVDNSAIYTKQEVDGVTSYVLKPGSDHAQLSEELWRFFINIYGGGPEIKLKSPATPDNQVSTTTREPFEPQNLTRKYSESDKEDYCTKANDVKSLSPLQKNQSLQNINRRYKRGSDENVCKYKHEPNGNYQDSDEEMEVGRHYNTVRMENGVDSSDHDTNDNPIHRSNEKTDIELPNLDSISLKNKPTNKQPKTGKVRKTKRRTVK